MNIHSHQGLAELQTHPQQGPFQGDETSLPINNCLRIVSIQEDNVPYVAGYYLEGDEVHVVAPGARQTMRHGGLPAETAAKIVLQLWIFDGRVAPHKVNRRMDLAS